MAAGKQIRNHPHLFHTERAGVKLLLRLSISPNVWYPLSNLQEPSSACTEPRTDVNVTKRHALHLHFFARSPNEARHIAEFALGNCQCSRCEENLVPIRDALPE